MIKRLIQQEKMALLLVYESNNRAIKYMKQKLTKLKRTIGNFTIAVENFNNSLSANTMKLGINLQ